MTIAQMFAENGSAGENAAEGANSSTAEAPAATAQNVPPDENPQTAENSSTNVADPATATTTETTEVSAPAFAGAEQLAAALAAAGVTSFDQLTESIAAQQRTEAIEQQLTPLAQQLVDQVESGQITEEQARDRIELERDRLTLNAERSAWQQSQRQGQLQQIQAQFPHANPQTLAALAGVPGVDLTAYAKAEHERVEGLLVQERAKYAAQKAKDGETYVPEGGAGTTAARPAAPSHRAPYSTLLGF